MNPVSPSWHSDTALPRWQESSDSPQGSGRGREISRSGGGEMTSAKSVSLRAVALLSLFLCTAMAALGQAGGAAQVSGVVSDTTGAIVPGAQVTIVQVDTKVSRTTTTDGTGFYLIPALSVG